MQVLRHFSRVYGTGINLKQYMRNERLVAQYGAKEGLDLLDVDVETFAGYVLFVVREQNQGWVLPMFGIVGEAEMEVVVALVEEKAISEDEVVLDLVLVDVDHGISCRVSVSANHYTPLPAIA